MSGFNQNLESTEKMKCLFCLTSKEPIIHEDGKLVCSECNTVIRSIPEKTNLPTIGEQVSS